MRWRTPFQDRGETGDLDEWLTIEGVTADLIEDGEEHRVVLHADRSLATLNSSEVAFEALDADLFLGADSLRIVSASLFKDDSYLRAEGALDFTNEATGAIDIQYALDGSLARLIDGELAVTGVVTGRARARFDTGDVVIDAQLSSDVIGWRTVIAHR